MSKTILNKTQIIYLNNKCESLEMKMKGAIFNKNNIRLH